MMQQENNNSIKQRVMKCLDDFTPPGISAGKELGGFAGGLAVAWLISMNYFNRLANARAELFHIHERRRVLIEGAVMENFSSVLGDSLNSFGFLCILLLGLVVWHYLYYHQETKSIYLMKRLSSRLEIHKRAWTLPLLAIAVTLIAVFLVLLLYFGIYMIATPEQCLAPGQWQNIWR